MTKISVIMNSHHSFSIECYSRLDYRQPRDRSIIDLIPIKRIYKPGARVAAARQVGTVDWGE